MPSRLQQPRMGCRSLVFFLLFPCRRPCCGVPRALCPRPDLVAFRCGTLPWVVWVFRRQIVRSNLCVSNASCPLGRTARRPSFFVSLTTIVHPSGQTKTRQTYIPSCTDALFCCSCRAKRMRTAVTSISIAKQKSCVYQGLWLLAPLS